MIGKTLNNRYTVVASIGRGGMGAVYRAHDTVLDRVVAVKIVSSSRLGTEGRARILLEARAAAALNHPNIIVVYDVEDIQDTAAETQETYIVMEFVDGPSLRDFDVQSNTQAFEIARQICLALAEAHDHGIIHRDLKPENILIAAGKGEEIDGASVKVKLTDFGLARITGRTRLTEEGAFMGTLSYLAPEIILGQPASSQSDLYALGVIFYELFAGRSPFEGDTPTAILSQHIHAPVVPPSTFNPEISAAADLLITKLLSKTPEDRPESANAVLAALSEAPGVGDNSDLQQPAPSLIRLQRGLMIGRQKEFSEATELWKSAMSGEGQLLLISGEPGVGKSRLIRELTTHAELSGGLALVSECYAEDGMVYLPIAQALRTLLGSDLKLDIPETILANLLVLTPDLRAFHADLPEPARLDPESEQMRLFESMVQLVHAVVKSGPLLFVIDDIHWADSGTLALFKHLARRSRKKCVMLVVAYRELELDEVRPFNDLLRDLTRERLATRSKLSRLTHEETGLMLAALFGREVSRDFHDRIFQETEGNPFFIEELCKNLVDNGQVYFEDGQWQRREIDEIELPQSIRLVVQGRVNLLPDEAQEVLKFASLLGREFEFDVLLKAIDLSEDIVITALELAEETQLIREVSHRREVVFAFSHGLIPSTLAESIRILRRRRMHDRLANALETLHPDEFEDLAFHYAHAGNEDQAYKYYVKSGERALANYANQDAVKYLQAALDLVEDTNEEARLRTELGQAQADLGLFKDVDINWSKVVEIYQELGHQEKLADIYARWTNRTWDSGDFAKALKIGKKGLQLLQDASPSSEMAYLLSEVGRASYFVGDLTASQPILRQALQMANEQQAVNIQAETLLSLAFFPDTSLPEKIELIEKAIEIAREANLPKTAARGLFNLAMTTWNYSGFDQIVNNCLVEALALVTEIGDVNRQKFFMLPFVWRAAGMGDIVAMKSWQRRINDLLDASSPSASVWQYRVSEGIICWWQGQLQEAEEIFREAAKATADMRDLQTFNNAAEVLCQLLMTESRLDEALETAEWWLETIGESREIHRVVYVVLATICARLGQVEKAQDFAANYRQLVGSTAVGLFEGADEQRMRAELAVATGSWPEANKAFTSLIALQEQLEVRLYRAAALWDWALALIHKGTPEDISQARKLAEEAEAEFIEMNLPYFIKKSKLLIQQLT